jgi:ParB-like chromosome segregation protein Spo0J
MNVTLVDPTTLNKATYNPRSITDKEKADIKASLQRFGFVEPVVVNKKNNTLVGGHQRVECAIELGIKQIPVNYVDLTLKQEKELNIRLNKNKAVWDVKILSAEFKQDELLSWGFEQDEIETLWEIEKKRTESTKTEREKQEEEIVIPTSRIVVFLEEKKHKQLSDKLASLGTNPNEHSKIILKAVKQLADARNK